VNEADKHRVSALEYASWRGHHHMADLLLRLGADPNRCVERDASRVVVRREMKRRSPSNAAVDASLVKERRRERPSSVDSHRAWKGPFGMACRSAG
jgi:ankyrin repeat protein